MVRHGYANCISCHVSPSGGGTLTQYGRSISASLLSTWAAKNEERFVYAVDQPDWAAFGGDVRTLSLFQNMMGQSRTDFILMQADAEAAVTAGKVTFDASAGMGHDGDFLSRRHYLNYRPNDNLSFRVGKFLPYYGINTENHSIGTRRGLGRDQGTETYNVEAAWIGETFDVFVTGIFGRPDNLNIGAETGGSISSSVFLGSFFKLGASYYYGTRSTESRQVAGPWAILGFTPHFFVLAEGDFQWFTPKIGGLSPVTKNGFVDYLRVDWEMTQGIHVYLLQEYNRLDLSTVGSMGESYGVGFQWFPRPHLEANLVYEKLRIGGPTGSFGDYAYAMAHFYL